MLYACNNSAFMQMLLGSNEFQKVSFIAFDCAVRHMHSKGTTDSNQTKPNRSSQMNERNNRPLENTEKNIIHTRIRTPTK